MRDMIISISNVAEECNTKSVWKTSTSLIKVNKKLFIFSFFSILNSKIGDNPDCFYIILNGNVSVLIDPPAGSKRKPVEIA